MGMTVERLNPDQLIAEAIRQSGCTDFGPAPMMEGFEVFCDALYAEAQLDEAGRRKVTDELVNILSQRLQVEDWYKRHPEIEAVEIKAPLFVMGLPRSGTSATSQHFDQDPQMRTLRRWELEWPTPPPTAAGQATDPRVKRMQDRIEARDAEDPARKAKINTNANDPGEHGVLLKYTFLSFHNVGNFYVPSYFDWLWTQDLTPGYAYVNRVLKLLLWKCPPPQWNLRHPMDIMGIDAILSVWPDARIVWTHRDPARTVPSGVSLLEGERKQFSPMVNHREAGSSLLAQCHAMVERGMQSRKALPPGRIVDLYNQDLVRDPLTTMAGAYERLGLEFTDAFAEGLRNHMRTRPKGLHGEHRPDLSIYGMTVEGIRAKFADYIEQCHVPLDA